MACTIKNKVAKPVYIANLCCARHQALKNNQAMGFDLDHSFQGVQPLHLQQCVCGVGLDEKYFKLTSSDRMKSLHLDRTFGKLNSMSKDPYPTVLKALKQ